ncbi:hypothetical protein ASZ90_018019 [hydrocarbon metagenome]|uniref:Uncharacterized protein n=1 Tax=hydrocarbon metagenome TaxID=938273 RepID=A0A0W8E7D9_9ZZZZ
MEIPLQGAVTNLFVTTISLPISSADLILKYIQPGQVSSIS